MRSLLMIDWRASLVQRDKESRTALHYAVAYKQKDIFYELLASGADLTAAVSSYFVQHSICPHTDSLDPACTKTLPPSKGMSSCKRVYAFEFTDLSQSQPIIAFTQEKVLGLEGTSVDDT